MPRHPLGDKAMTGAERLRRWRERERQERPVQDKPTSAELTKARQDRQAAQAHHRA